MALFRICMYALEISVVPSGKCSRLNNDIEKQVINTSVVSFYIYSNIHEYTQALHSRDTAVAPLNPL